MKHFKPQFFLIATCYVVLSACSGNDDFAEKTKQPQDSVPQIVAPEIHYPEEPGMVGVFDVPEMPVLSKMDSAQAKDMAFQLGKDYSVLENELKAIGAELDGAPGVINYNNNPKNIKFECLLPIKRLPAKQPTQCSIVVLEATKMLVYNFYGPYENLRLAYADIQKQLALHKLNQSGPMREFYITDPTLQPDPTKWLTRIMLPVE